MRRSVACVLLLAFGAWASAEEKKVESKDGRFSAAFPAEATSVPQTVAGHKMTITVALQGQAMFAVNYLDLPAAEIKNLDLDKTEPFGLGGLTKVTRSEATTFGKEKFPTREVAGEIDGKHLRAKLIVADKRLYQVIVFGPADVVGGTGADKFFASFEITK